MLRKITLSALLAALSLGIVSGQAPISSDPLEPFLWPVRQMPQSTDFDNGFGTMRPPSTAPFHAEIQPVASGKAAGVTHHLEMPGLIQFFIWNAFASDWDTSTQYNYNYRIDGKRLDQLELAYNNGNFVQLRHQVYAYDNAGNAIENLELAWNGTSWENYKRTQLSYDTFGNTTMTGIELWNGSSWDTFQLERTLYSYAFGNHIDTLTVQKYNLMTHSWRNFRMEVSAYNADSLEIEFSMAAWNGGNWQPQERLLYSYFPNRDLQTAQHFWFDGSGWDLWLEQSYTGWHNYEKGLYYACVVGSPNLQPGEFLFYERNYFPYESFHEVGYRQLYADITTNWMYKRKNDSNGHRVLEEIYNYDSGFTLGGGIHLFYTYDNQGQTTEIKREVWTNGVFEFDRRAIYGQFFTGIEAGQQLQGITAYPNPASEVLKFNMQLLPSEPVQIQLFDLEGRLRMESLQTSQGLKDIEVPLPSVLANGTYVYRLTTESGFASGKIIVQH